MLGAVTFGHEQMQIAIKAINELAAEAGKPKWSWVAPEPNKELQAAVSAIRRDGPCRRVHTHRKAAALRQDQGDQGRSGRSAGQGRDAEIHRRTSRRRVFQSGISTGARAKFSTVIRASTAATPRPCAPINIRTGVLARTHGSALFTRGETQALVVTTLGHRARCADHRRPDGREAKSRSCCTTISLRSASARPA